MNGAGFFKIIIYPMMMVDGYIFFSKSLIHFLQFSPPPLSEPQGRVHRGCAPEESKGSVP